VNFFSSSAFEAVDLYYHIHFTDFLFLVLEANKQRKNAEEKAQERQQNSIT